MSDEIAQEGQAPAEATQAPEASQAPSQPDPAPTPTPTFGTPQTAAEEPSGSNTEGGVTSSDVDPTAESSDPGSEDRNEFGGPDEVSTTSDGIVPRAVIPERIPLQTTVPVDQRNGDQSSFSQPSPGDREAAYASAAEREALNESINAEVNQKRDEFRQSFALTDQGQQHKQVEAAEAAMRDTGTATREGHDWLDFDPNAPSRVV